MSDWLQAHAEYIRTVSRAEYASSAEFNAELWRFMDARKPQTILDLGSGFTSYVTRLWAADNDAIVWSVDDSPSWLETTTKYLQKMGVKTKTMVLWDYLQERYPDRKYDLVVYDMGVLATRLRKLREALDHVRPGGAIFCDDMNWNEMQTAMGDFGKLRGFEVTMLPEAVDSFKRHPGYAIMPDPPVVPEPKVKVIIGVPMERNIRDRVALNLLAFAQMGFPFVHQEYTRTDMARDQFGYMLLQWPRFTHVLMLDSDQLHPPDIVNRLVRHVIEDPAKLIVGGLNNRRGKPYEPNGYWLDEKNCYYTIPDWEPGVQKVDALGTGCILISRTVFEIMPPTWFGYTYDRAAERVYPSDDTCFARRCQEWGIQQWCDPAVNSPHLGDADIDMAFMRSWLERNQDQIVDGKLVIK